MRLVGTVFLAFFLASPLSASAGGGYAQCPQAIVAQAEGFAVERPLPQQLGATQVRFYNPTTGRTVLVREIHESSVQEALAIWRDQSEGQSISAGTSASSVALMPLAYCAVAACVATLNYYVLQSGIVGHNIFAPNEWVTSAQVWLFSWPLWFLPVTVVPPILEQRMNERALGMVERASREGAQWPWNGAVTVVVLAKTSPDIYWAIARLLRERGYAIGSVPW